MSQTVFKNPYISVAPAITGSGNGTISVDKLTHFTITQTYTLTCVAQSPDTLFAVAGSLDGSLGIATVGTQFFDSDLKVFLTIQQGSNPWQIGDQITFTVANGTDVTQQNIDSYDEWPQKNFGTGVLGQAKGDHSLRYSDTAQYGYLYVEDLFYQSKIAGIPGEWTSLTYSQYTTGNAAALTSQDLTFTAAPGSAGNGITMQYLQYSVALYAMVTMQDILFQALTAGTGGNAISVTFTGGAVAGSEVVTVVGNAITVQIASGTSTATQIVTKVTASSAAMALLGNCQVASGHSGTAHEVTQAQTFLAGGTNAVGLAGSEVVTVSGTAITVQFQSGVSTATQIRTAILASSAAMALITPTISGTGSNTQTNAPLSTPTNLAGGTDGLGFSAPAIVCTTETISLIDGTNPTGNIITVYFRSGVHTASQIKAAIDADPTASTLVSAAYIGTSSNPQLAPVAKQYVKGSRNKIYSFNHNELTQPLFFAEGNASAHVKGLQVDGRALFGAHVEIDEALSLNDLNATNNKSGAPISNVQAALNSLLQNQALVVSTSGNTYVRYAAGSIFFLSDILFTFKTSGIYNNLPVSNSPIAIADGQSLYVMLDPTTTGPCGFTVASTVSPAQNAFRVASRSGNYITWFDGVVTTDNDVIRLGSGQSEKHQVRQVTCEGGLFTHDAVTVGMLSWNGTLKFKPLGSSAIISINAANVTLNDDDVAYISLPDPVVTGTLTMQTEARSNLDIARNDRLWIAHRSGSVIYLRSGVSLAQGDTRSFYASASIAANANTAVSRDTSGNIYNNKSFVVPGSAGATGFDVSSAGDLEIGASVGANNIYLGGSSSVVKNRGTSTILGGILTMGDTTAAATSSIRRGASDGVLNVSGGLDTTHGGNVALYGGTHATKPTYTEFYQASTLVGSIGASGLWTLGTSGSTQSHIVNGNLSVSLKATLGPTSANSTNGGRVVLNDDTGATRWTVGLLGTAAATAFSIQDNVASNSTRFSINNNGLVTIGASGSSQTHVVNGNASVTGLLTASSGAISNDLTFAQIATPAAPPAGYTKIYSKNDGKMYYYPAGGAETAIGSGSGGGSKNYVANTNFESNGTNNWSLWRSTLTGVFPTQIDTSWTNATSSFSALSLVTGGLQLAGTNSLSLAATGATVAGDMLVSDAWTIDKEDQAKVMAWKCYFSVPSGATNGNFSGTASNTFAIWFYDWSAQAWIMPTGAYSMTQTGGVGIAQGTFQTSATSTRYSIAVVCINASAGAITLYLDDFVVGPQSISYGNAIRSPQLAGFIQEWAGIGDPTGWMLCDGRTLSRYGQYSDLFSAIGCRYGIGDGTGSTFSLPDFRGQFLRGMDNMGTAMGAAGQDPNASARTALRTSTFTLTSSTTTSGSSTVGVSSTSKLAVGMPVSGTGIPASSLVLSIIDSTHFQLGNFSYASVNATATGSVTVTVTNSWISSAAATTLSSSTVQVTSTTNMAIGMSVSGTNIPASSIIIAIIDATHIQIGNTSGTAVNATATGSGINLTLSLSATAVGQGSAQADATAKNGLSLTDPTHTHAIQNATGGFGAGTDPIAFSPNSASTGLISAASTGITLGAGDSETRPLNVYTNYIIKLYNDQVAQMSADTDSRVCAMQVNQATPTATLSSTASLVKFTATPSEDTHGAYSTTTGLYQVLISGFYRCTYSIGINATYTAGQGALARIAKNGTVVLSSQVVASGNNGTIYPLVTGTVWANAGDNLAPYSDCSGTSPVIAGSSTSNYFHVERLSGSATIADSGSVNCRVTGCTTSIPTGTTTTLVFATTSFDSHNQYNSGTYTIAISGKYRIHARVQAAGTSNANTLTSLSIYQNGVSQGGDSTCQQGNANSALFMRVTDTLSCLAGDQITIRLNQNGGSTVTCNGGLFTIERVGN